MTRLLFGRRSRRSLLVMLLVGGCVLAWGASAAACGNAVRFATDRASQMVSKSEKRLQRGRVASAYEHARQAHKILARAEGRWVPNMNQVRALRYRTEQVMAIAVVRLNGTAHLPKGLVQAKIGKTTRERNLRVAVKTLIDLQEHLHDTPKFIAHVAEARLVFEANRDEGSSALEELARDDLLPDAWAHRALALARHQAGNLDARDLAVISCRNRTKTKRACDDFLTSRERREAASGAKKSKRPKKKEPKKVVAKASPPSA